MFIFKKKKKLTQAKHAASRAYMPRGLNYYTPFFFDVRVSVRNVTHCLANIEFFKHGY